jgi:hypothetical protein
MIGRPACPHDQPRQFCLIDMATILRVKSSQELEITAGRS